VRREPERRTDCRSPSLARTKGRSASGPVARHFGSFEPSIDVPESVDADKIEASFKKGVLTVTLPKKREAQKPAKKIEVKAA
jgi:HSP20 family molecular chaperone IbpA